MCTQVYKFFDLQITSANDTYSETFELEKNITRIIGILFTSQKDDQPFLRGSQRLEINKREIFPEGYETKIVSAGLNVPCDNKYLSVDIPVGNGLIKLDYRDEDDGRSTFSAYRLRLNLICEMEEIA